MKKIIWYSIVILFPMQIFAVNGRLDCYQKRPYLQMTMVWNDEAGFRLSLISEEGINGLPLYNGVVTVPMISLIKQESDDLIRWPRLVELSWGPQQCQRNIADPWVLECNGTANMSREFSISTTPQWPYSTYLFKTYSNRKQSLSEVFESREMTWTVEVDGSIYMLGFSFQKEHCIER